MPGAVAHTPYGMTEGLLLTDVTLDEIRADKIRAAETHDNQSRGTEHAPATRADTDASPVAPGGVCVGRPAPGVTVRISPLSGDGSTSDGFDDLVDVTGEIVVSAPHLFDHYDHLCETDRASRRGSPAGQRWHRTGDVGHLDDGGRLWVEGRLLHVITTADGVVTPVGPEQNIETLAAVSRAAVVGVGPRGTQQIVVVVETTASSPRVALADADLATRVRRVADHPVAAVLVVPELPTDIRHNSKIDRARLGSWAAAILAGGPLSAPR